LGRGGVVICRVFYVGAFAFCWRDNHDLAAFCAQVAESLLRKFDRKYAQSVIPVLNLSIYAYRKPLQSCAEAFLDSCREAMAAGDVPVDWAIASLPWKMSKMPSYASARKMAFTVQSSSPTTACIWTTSNVNKHADTRLTTTHYRSR